MFLNLSLKDKKSPASPRFDSQKEARQQPEENLCKINIP
jgi:hypothetical protein